MSGKAQQSVNPVGYLETGVLYCDDNLHRLGQFPAACVDLVYLDPPFFSNRSYEVIWGDEAEVRSFEDRWEGGINVYLDWMEARLQLLHRVLKPTGSLYLHCDPNASHYLKVLTDDIFKGQFRNEIIWQRSAVKGDARLKFGANHDVLLYYGKSADTFFDVPRRTADDDYLARFDLDDHDGRGSYHSAPLDSPSPRPNLTYSYKGYDPPAKGWRVDRDAMEKLDAEGRLIFPSKPTGRIRRKLFLADAPGPPVGDVWTDIPPLQAASVERIGYPTQKPEALLERIISSSCPRDGIVLDPFCGCGTSVAVACQLGRQWIGIDISPQAVEIMKLRLNKLGASPVLEGVPTSVEDFRGLPPFEFQERIIQLVHADPSARKTVDMGVDGYSFFERLPIQVKRQDRVDRPQLDKFETAIRREGKQKGYFIAFSFTRGAIEAASKTRREREVEIVLVTVEDVLRVGDLVRAADEDGRAPDLSEVSKDLMGLFKALEQEVTERPFFSAPSKASKARAGELVESARASSPVPAG